MQDKDKNENKETLLIAAGKVVRRFRDKGATVFYYERDLAPRTILPIEKGQSDMKLSTMFKVAEAFNLSLSEFAKLIEMELPKGFSLLNHE